MSLRTSTEAFGDVVVVHCSGRIVFGEESTSLRTLVKDLLRKSRQIVLDLGEVASIDSGGLGTLVGLYISARNASGNVKLARVRGRPDEILHVTRLVNVFELFDGVEQAVASFHTGFGRRVVTGKQE